MKKFLKTFVAVFFIIFLLFVVFKKNKPSTSYAKLISSPSPQVFLPGPLNLLHYDKAVLGITQQVDPDKIIELVNKHRQKVGSSSLVKNNLLTKAAQMRAEVILRTQNISHIDPYENIQLNTVLPKVGYSYIYASENIALAQGSAAGFVNGWIQSPSHKYNLEDPFLEETGVGVVNGKFGNYYVTIAVQIFAVPVKTSQNLTDQQKITKTLAAISHQQDLNQKYLSLSPNSYYQNWQKLLNRQKNILLSLKNQLSNKNPQSIYKLIFQYNKNWQNSPKIN